MTAPTALLALEDGTVFRGSGFGAEGEAFGEAVFNTGMTGYQEVLTDPSYTGQIVTMTSPQQGNYGMHATDAESERIHVAGFAVREAARRASNPRADGTLGEGLDAAGVIGIEGIDTRKLTLRIRDAGAMRAAISTEDLEPTSLVDRVRESPGMAGADLARTVTTPEPYDAGAVVGPADTSRGRLLRVAVYDFGVKRNILRMLAAAGMEATVVPAETPARDVVAGGFDGVLLSNGPGDPAATPYGRRDPTAGQAPDVRDLPRAPAAGPRARRTHLQDAVRSSGREPAGPGHAHGRGADHQSQPRLRGRSHGVGTRSGRVRPDRVRPHRDESCQPQRRHAGRAPLPRRPGVLGPVPPRGGTGTTRRPRSVRRLPNVDGRSRGLKQRAFER